MDKVEKMLEEMKKVWNTELDCACCRKTFRLGDMFAICGDCYTLFPKDKKVHAKYTWKHGSIRHIKKKV